MVVEDQESIDPWPPTPQERDQATTTTAEWMCIRAGSAKTDLSRDLNVRCAEGYGWEWSIVLGRIDLELLLFGCEGEGEGEG